MIRTPLLALLVVLIALPGCDTNAGQDDFFLQSTLLPEGFTRTGDSGVIDSTQVDPDDWRVAPFFFGAIEVDPIYPNPASRTDVVTVVIRDPFEEITGGVQVRGYDDNGRSIPLGDDPGEGLVYAVSFSPLPLRVAGGDDARLYRIQVFDNNSRIISYGDLLVR
jgi:hypothetical protein